MTVEHQHMVQEGWAAGQWAVEQYRTAVTLLQVVVAVLLVLVAALAVAALIGRGSR